MVEVQWVVARPAPCFCLDWGMASEWDTHTVLLYHSGFPHLLWHVSNCPLVYAFFFNVFKYMKFFTNFDMYFILLIIMITSFLKITWPEIARLYSVLPRYYLLSATVCKTTNLLKKIQIYQIIILGANIWKWAQDRCDFIFQKVKKIQPALLFWRNPFCDSNQDQKKFYCW